MQKEESMKCEASSDMEFKAREVVKELNKAFDYMAVCHCGNLCKDHTVWENHSPVWLPCSDTQMLSDAAHIINYFLILNEDNKGRWWGSRLFFEMRRFIRLMRFWK